MTSPVDATGRLRFRWTLPPAWVELPLGSEPSDAPSDTGVARFAYLGEPARKTIQAVATLRLFPSGGIDRSEFRRILAAEYPDDGDGTLARWVEDTSFADADAVAVYEIVAVDDRRGRLVERYIATIFPDFAPVAVQLRVSASNMAAILNLPAVGEAMASSLHLEPA